MNGFNKYWPVEFSKTRFHMYKHVGTTPSLHVTLQCVGMLDQVIHMFLGSQFNDKSYSIPLFQLTECCVNVLVTVFKETILQECAQMIRNNETESKYTSDGKNFYTHETEFLCSSLWTFRTSGFFNRLYIQPCTL